MAANFNSADKESWYFGNISRQETQERLQNLKHGTFLVRDSTSCIGDFVLSVSENSKVSHYIINNLQSRLKIGDQMFNTMPELLDFYKIHYLDTTTLIEPVSKHKEVPKNRSELKHISYPFVSSSATPASQRMSMQDTVDGNVQPPPNSSGSVLVRGLFDFKSDDPDDLPFNKGEILEVIEKPEENWWNARNSHGRVGQIPVPYIEVYTPSRPTPSYNQVSSGDRTNDRAQRRLSGTNVDHNKPIFAQVITPRVPNAYDPTALALEVGQVIKVLKMNKTGQWEGEYKNKRGWFPFTHVKIIDDK